MGRKSFNLDSEFYCTKCGRQQLFTVPRMNGKGREAGHLKRMYCFSCNEEHNFVECKPFTKYDYHDFCLEYRYNNFTPDGIRVMEYGFFRDMLHKKGIDLYEEIDINDRSSWSR